MKRLFVATSVALSLFALGACKSAEPYAAKVNGVTLSQKDLDAELEAIGSNKEYREQIESEAQQSVRGQGDGTFNSTFVSRVLNRRVLYELVHQEVVKRRLKLKASDRSLSRSQIVQSIPGGEDTLKKFPDSYVDEIVTTNAEVNVLQAALAKVTDENLRKYYNDHKDQYENVCAAHILVSTKAGAESIEKQLKAAKDKAAKFAELAKKSSKDPGSGANGGDLGCASPAGYVEEFKDAVRKQAVGVIGPPVQTQYGYHIIRVDRRDPVKPFAEVKEEIRQALVDDQQGPFTDFLRKATLDAKIEVNPRYGSYDRTGEVGQVVPPKAPSGDNTKK